MISIQTIKMEHWFDSNGEIFKMASKTAVNQAL